MRRALIAAAAFNAVCISRSVLVIDGASYSRLFDDAMISMRYARDHASGYGLVWNRARLGAGLAALDW